MQAPAPVLIYGPRKSGSTLLKSLLDGSRDLFMLPGELKLKYLFSEDYFTAEEKAPAYVRGAQKVYELYVNVQRSSEQTWEVRLNDDFKLGTLTEEQLASRLEVEAFREGLEHIANADVRSTRKLIRRDVRNLQDALTGETSDYPTWGAKEVGGDPRRFLTRFRDLFPHARFVFILRDPRFVVRSIILDRRRKGRTLSTVEIIREMRHCLKILTFLKKLTGRERAFFVRYEQLVREPASTMRDLTDFLDVPFDESVHTVPTTLGVASKVRTSSRDTTEVFHRPESDWREGLSGREAFLLGRLDLLRSWSHYFASEPYVNYADFRRG